jgi:uncharacterized delta-60 repeat protein
MNLTRKTFGLAQFILVVFVLAICARAAGEVDPTFNAYLANVGSGTVVRTAIQPDGKIIITGIFSTVSGVPVNSCIVRLNTDGTLDTTFNAPVITGGSPFNIESLAVQSDGKIVIGGPFQKLDGVWRQGLARLNQNGSADIAFNTSSGVDTIAQVNDLKIYPDDKILFCGIRNGGFNVITRLNADGSVSAENPAQPAYRLNFAPDGKVVYSDGPSTRMRRLNENLTNDNTFTQSLYNTAIYAITVQPDGKILVGGNFSVVNGTSSPGLVRINTDGSVDVPFVLNSSGGFVQAIVYMPSGKILVGGGSAGISIRNSDGTLDSSFTATHNFTVVYDADLQTDGKIIAGGSWNGFGVPQNAVTRFNSNGSPDPSFLPAIGGFGLGGGVRVLPDNKILLTGIFNYVNGAPRSARLVKFDVNGTLDTGFNPTVFTSGVLSFDVLPNGKIVGYGATGGGTKTVRLNSDGTTDIEYTSVANVKDLKAQPDGKVLVSGDQNLRRYNVDGSLDLSFNVSAVGQIFKIALQPDGKIVIGGSFTQINGTNRSKIARLNADGTLDTSFNSPAGGINGSVVRDIDIQADGRVVIVGDFSSISFEIRNSLARLNADGNLDTSFVPSTTTLGYCVKIQPDGKILADRYRFNANGMRDTSFNVSLISPSGGFAHAVDIDLQTDGKIIMVGEFATVNGSSHSGIVRLLNSPTVLRSLFDYDGDGKADVSVYRPSTNRWYVFKSSDSTVTETTFGIAGDVPVPADFDGDGKTDIAIFRPSSGDWWSLSSQNGAQIFAHWGTNGDIPRPSDFDGDGRTDYVVFRPSDNFWYRISSANGSSSNAAFGLAGDKPVTGDFDGDGKSDKAIYRPSSGDWWFQSSLNGAQLATHWGISTDIPAPADFDGDGKTDFAVYRPSTGVWYIINSSNFSFTIMNFGIAEDKPVPADYDGDGRADIAVFRPSTGTWYQMKTTAGFAAQQFGISTDVPTENAFVP